MRAQIAGIIVLVSGVVGCAGTPPPRPMVAMEAPPAPAPAPMAAMPVDGTYQGSVMSTPDSRPRCRAMPATATTRERDGGFNLGGMRGRVGPDGTVSSTSRRGSSMTGTLAGGTLDVTTMRGGCGYHYTLAHS